MIVTGGILEGNGVNKTYALNIKPFIHGVAKHKEISELFQKQINNTWIPRFNIPEKIELEGFERTAKLIFVIIVYMLGLALTVFGRYLDSSRLLEMLKETNMMLNPVIQKRNPKANKILNDILRDVYYFLAREFYDENDMSKARLYVDKSLELGESYYPLLQRGYIEFTVDRDPSKALVTTTKAEMISNHRNSWMFNKAFLLMYLKRYNDAIDLYDRIYKDSLKRGKPIVDDVIKYIKRILKEEPHRYEFYYVLGFIYYKILNKERRAIKYFRIVLDKSDSMDSYYKLRKQALKYYNELIQTRHKILWLIPV
jgi:tetratricopeptide (TPR) repeat protein